MANNPETGHAKNVSNFESLISFVKGYRTTYNPSKNSIRIEALEVILANAKKSLIDIDTVFPAYTNAVSAREFAFAPLSKIITRVNNAIKATDTTEQVDESVKSIVRKLQGIRASAKISEEDKQKLATEGKEVNQISASQMGYDNRLENLYKLIMLLNSIPQYNPNEEELKISTLTALYEDLKAKNTAVVETTTPLSNARIARNETMYKPLSGLVDISFDSKVYIKSVFGPSSPQYKQVSKLEFKSLAKL
jgi:hypothetical protein